MATALPGTSIGVELADPALESAVQATLIQVEDQLRAAVNSDDPLIAEAARHLVDAGGKRFRPLLVAIAAQFGPAGRASGSGVPMSAGPPLGGPSVVDPAAVDPAVDPAVVDSAVVVELTHLATLYHDDVMDEAHVRRGAPSANARWGNSIAILVGDFLFARAALVAAKLGPEAVRIQAATFARLVHGQIAETVGPRGDSHQVTHYLHVIEEKTGSLIATSARFGAMFGGAPPVQVEALARYGEAMGIAFQLSDDLLDIASESMQSGKTPGTDLREGVPTLPVLYALAADDPDPDQVRLRELLSAGPLTEDSRHAEALALLRASPAVQRARQTVRRYAERARAELPALPDVPARRALDELCEFIVDRTG